jgi:hypothetical protein
MSLASVGEFGLWWPNWLRIEACALQAPIDITYPYRENRSSLRFYSGSAMSIVNLMVDNLRSTVTPFGTHLIPFSMETIVVIAAYFPPFPSNRDRAPSPSILLLHARTCIESSRSQEVPQPPTALLRPFPAGLRPCLEAIDLGFWCC